MNSILNILKLTKEEKIKGVWLSGVWGKGEYKDWHDNGQLFEHSYWRGGRVHGLRKCWHDNGHLFRHELWKKGEIVRNYIHNENTRLIKTNL